MPNDELYDGFVAALESCNSNKGILSSENAIEEINNRMNSHQLKKPNRK